MRHGQLVAGRRRQRLVVERVRERPENQRQGRPEFMADIAEEQRLRAIEFGQRLGSRPSLLQSFRAGDRRADLCGDQRQKAAVLVVQHEPRRKAGDEHTERPVGALLHDREDEGAAVGSLDSRRGSCPNDVAERPRPGCSQLDGRRSGVFWRVAGGADQRRVTLVAVDEVDRGKGHVVRIPAEHARGDAAGIDDPPRVAGIRGQCSQRRQTAGTQHPRGRFGHRDQNPADATALLANGAVQNTK